MPIGGAAIVVILVFLHIKRVNNPDNLSLLTRLQELDLLGAAILVPSIVCLLLALQWGGSQYPWNDSKIIGLFVGFGLMAILFVAIQLWKQEKGTVPPFLFKNRNVLCAFLFAFFFGAAFFPLIYYLCMLCPLPLSPSLGNASRLTGIDVALYFQAIQGASAVQAGIKLLPLLISVVISSVLTGGLVSAVGYYNPFILPSMVLFAAGAGMITTFTITSPFSVWFGYQVLCGMFPSPVIPTVHKLNDPPQVSA